MKGYKNITTYGININIKLIPVHGGNYYASQTYEITASKRGVLLGKFREYAHSIKDAESLGRMYAKDINDAIKRKLD